MALPFYVAPRTYTIAVVFTVVLVMLSQIPALRVLRRMNRDITERGRTMESVIDQYLQVVRPMHLQFVWPSKRYAHLIIPEGGHNTVAIDLIATKIKNIISERDRLRALDREVQEARADETARRQEDLN